MQTDPISDMLTRIRNAQAVSLRQVHAPSSKIKLAIVKVLHDEGYLSTYSCETGDDNKPTLAINLKYYEGLPVIARIGRVSRPGLRVYRKYNDLPSMNAGLGVLVISTNQGVMSDREARRLCLGGEVLCYVA